MSGFRDLKVWQKAHILGLDTHRIAGGIRGRNNASLRSQTIRAAMSVRKMLYGLIRALEARPSHPPPVVPPT